MNRPDCFTLHRLFQSSFRQFAPDLAISGIEGSTFTFGELEEAVRRLQGRLAAQGVGPGDKVALLGPSCPHWVVAYVAVTTMSAVVVPILPDFSEEAIENIIEHAECRLAVCADRFLPLVTSGRHPRLRAVLTLETLQFNWSREAAPQPGQIAEPAEDDLAAILYTSGTTGVSKGVMLTHRAIAHNAWAGTQVATLSPGDRMLSVLPLAHTFECTLGMVLPLASGASVYYLEKPPTAKLLLPALAKIRPTHMLTVPLIIEKIFRLRVLPQINDRAVSRFLYRFPPLRRLIHRQAGRRLYKMFGGHLRFFGIGGAPLAPDVERFLRDARFPYAIGYGLTETAPLAAGSNAGQTRMGAIGPVIPEVEVRIEPREGSANGEILVRGPNVMRGYFKDPDATAEVLSADGWLKTGDLGHFSKDGYLTIKGRLKNMLLGPSGENIYPEEIEAVLSRFETVIESVVVERWGALVARVHVNREVLEERYNSLRIREKQFEVYVQEQLEEIRRNVNKHLASFSRLHEIVEELEPFEKTPTNKIKRYLYSFASA